MPEQTTLRFKVLMLGEGTVGKTTFKNRFLSGKFTSGYTATIGADFASHKMEFDGHQVIMSIWDMAGQKTQATLRKSFYTGANGALLLYDVTKKQTYDYIEEEWLKQLEDVLKQKIPVLLIANKVDLEDEREITFERGQEMLNTIKEQGWYAEFLETSALLGTNVNKSFTDLIQLMLEDYKNRQLYS